MNLKLPTSIWRHALLHVVSLFRIRLSAYHNYSSLQLVYGIPPNIFYLWTFVSAVYVPVAPPQRTKMGPQRRI